MKFHLKDTEYEFPSTLHAITLGKRVAFYHTYGKELDARAKVINDMPDGFEKDVAVSDWHLDMAVLSFSHYTGIPLETVKSETSIESLMMVYNTDMTLLAEQEANIVVEPYYMWNDEEWHIAAPEVTPANEMKLDEFICAKEITRQIQALGQGKWDALPYLCAVYFRKKDEEFNESFISAGSERLTMMNDLPLDIALGVGFFLTSTLSIYKTTLVSSEKESQRESIQPVTSTDGGG